MLCIAEACLATNNEEIEPECTIEGRPGPGHFGTSGPFVFGQVVVTRGNLGLTDEKLANGRLKKISCVDGSEGCVYRYPRWCGDPETVAAKLSANIFACGRKSNALGPIAPESIGKVFPHAIIGLPTSSARNSHFDASGTAGDPYFAMQVDLNALGAEQAWQRIMEISSSTITTAVIDGGIDMDHPDLMPQLEKGIEIPCRSGPCDGGNPNGDHGTAMAGIIGAGRNNGWMLGVAWNTRLLPIRISAGNRAPFDAAAAVAVRCAAHRGARVLNFSIGGDEPTPLLEDALLTTPDQLLIVVPSGNVQKDIVSSPVYPASYSMDRMIVVASHTENNMLEATSGYGAIVEIAAPGRALYPIACHSSAIERCFDISRDSTSHATAYVSGAAALLWSAYGDWNYSDIKWRILETADDEPLIAWAMPKPRRLNLARMMQPVSFTKAVGDRISKSDTGLIDTRKAFPPGMCTSVNPRILPAHSPGAAALTTGDLKIGLNIEIAATCTRSTGGTSEAVSGTYTVTN